MKDHCVLPAHIGMLCEMNWRIPLDRARLRCLGMIKVTRWKTRSPGWMYFLNSWIKWGLNSTVFMIAISPELNDLSASNAALDQVVAKLKEKQAETGVKLLWGTACLFAHPRYAQGAATSPDAAVYAYAAAQVKKAIEVTNELDGLGYTFWGGREGLFHLVEYKYEA